MGMTESNQLGLPESNTDDIFCGKGLLIQRRGNFDKAVCESRAR